MAGTERKDEPWETWLKSKGWVPYDTESAARMVARMAVEDIAVARTAERERIVAMLLASYNLVEVPAGPKGASAWTHGYYAAIRAIESEGQSNGG